MEFSQARFNPLDLSLQLGMGYLFDKAKKSFIEKNNITQPVQDNSNQMLAYYNNIYAMYNYQQPQYQYSQTFI